MIEAKDISIKEVPEHKRLDFMPQHFGPAMMAVEQRIFAYAEAAIRKQGTREPCYNGGFWNFAEASNGAGWMWPASVPEVVDLGPVGDLGGDVRGISRVAAGLAITCCALNHELWRQYERRGDCELTRKLDEAWRQATELAYECSEADKLIRWLD